MGIGSEIMGPGSFTLTEHALNEPAKAETKQQRKCVSVCVCVHEAFAKCISNETAETEKQMRQEMFAQSFTG